MPIFYCGFSAQAMLASIRAPTAGEMLSTQLNVCAQCIMWPPSMLIVWPVM